jgi:hypothetical protein
LRIEDFLSALDDPATITLSDLKRWKIREFTVSEETPSRHFSLYDAIIYEVPEGFSIADKTALTNSPCGAVCISYR